MAVPPSVAYALATRIEDFPEYLERVNGAEWADDHHATIEASARGTARTLELELLSSKPDERLEWRAHGELEHFGIATFHELAPRLTHIELCVEPEEQGMVRRLAQTAHLTERAIRENLHQFKAYAERLAREEADEELEAVAAEAGAEDADADEPDEPARSAADDADADESDEDVPEEDGEEESEDAGDEPVGEKSGEPSSSSNERDPADLAEPANAYSKVLEDYESDDAYAEILGEDEYEQIGQRS